MVLHSFLSLVTLSIVSPALLPHCVHNFQLFLSDSDNQDSFVPFSLRVPSCLAASSLEFSESFCRVTYILTPVSSSPGMRLSSNYQRRGLISHSNSEVISVSNFLCRRTLLSFWMAFFAVPMCVRIPVSHSPSTVKSLFRYINLCTCFCQGIGKTWSCDTTNTKPSDKRK